MKNSALFLALACISFSCAAGCDDRKSGKIPFISPPRLAGLESKFDTGLFSHDLVIANKASGDLQEVEITVTFYREDGEKPAKKQFWSTWRFQEEKRINVPSHQYQKVTVVGSAIVNGKAYKIEESWTWTWGGKK
jgi:hypothetical protein